MFALMIVLAVGFAIECLGDLIHIAEGKPATKTPSHYVAVFALNAVLLAFILYALLNWL